MTREELIKTLSEGYSVQSETANKFWLFLIISCIITITGKPEKESGLIELPFTLGKVNIADFYSIMIILICILLIAFASAMIQAIRASKLIRAVINTMSEQDKFHYKVHIQDLVDCTVKPTFNRVAPVAQYLLGKNQFLGDAKPRKDIKLFSSIFYSFLKITTFIFIYIIPIFSIYKSWTGLSLHRNELTIHIPVFFLLVLVVLAAIATIILLVGDVKYFSGVMIRINAK